MNKSQLAEQLAQRAGIPIVRASRYIDIFFESIAESLQAGGKVTISDFGTFTVSSRKAFQGHNPRTKMPMTISAVKIPVFRAGKALKSALNGG